MTIGLRHQHHRSFCNAPGGPAEAPTSEQLAAQRTARKAREQELKLLMDGAEQSTSAAFVNLIAYKSDYVTAQEDLKVIEATARVKKCSTPENWRSNSAIQ